MSPNLVWTGAAVLLAWLAYRKLPSSWTRGKRLIVAALIWACIETFWVLSQAYEAGRV